MKLLISSRRPKTPLRHLYHFPSSGPLPLTYLQWMPSSGQKYGHYVTFLFPIGLHVLNHDITTFAYGFVLEDRLRLPHYVSISAVEGHRRNSWMSTEQTVYIFCEFVRNYDLYYCKFATDKIFLVSNWRCTVSLVYHEFTNILTAVVIDTVVHSNLKQFLLPGS